MATSIIPLAIEMAFTASDAEIAAQYKSGYCCMGRMSSPDDLTFYLDRHDGHTDAFTPNQLRQLTWWRALTPRTAAGIEATIFPFRQADARYRYIARGDRKSGGRLIRGSRLSAYFEGETRDEQAMQALTELRATYADAAVFLTDDIDDAERLLQSENPQEGSLLIEERQVVARFTRDIRSMNEARS